LRSEQNPEYFQGHRRIQQIEADYDRAQRSYFSIEENRRSRNIYYIGGGK